MNDRPYDSLESLCSSTDQFSNIYIDFSSDIDLPPITVHQSTAFYRLVQEGLKNAIKHANASSIWDHVDGEVSISLKDIGRAFKVMHNQNRMICEASL